MLHLESMPEETARLFVAVAQCPGIDKFTLIGGTALALHFAHRRSEDLDFSFLGHDLPRDVCSAVIDHLSATGWTIEDITSEDARIEHMIDGSYVADSHQDWLCRLDQGNGVKLTFFAEYEPQKQAVYELFPEIHCNGINILPPDGIFVLKSQLLLRRATLRDLFDLWVFLERGGTVEQILENIRLINPRYNEQSLRTVLLPPRLPATDPGLESLVEHGPQSLEAVKQALQPHIDAYERRLAAEIFEETPDSPHSLTP